MSQYEDYPPHNLFHTIHHALFGPFFLKSSADLVCCVWFKIPAYSTSQLLLLLYSEISEQYFLLQMFLQFIPLCGKVTYIFSSQEVQALSHLKGKPQQVIDVQRPVSSLLADRVLNQI